MATRRWSKESFQINTMGGNTTVEGYVWGPFGADQRGGSWHLTHLATGFRMAKFPRLKDAKSAADEFLDALDADHEVWSKTNAREVRLTLEEALGSDGIRSIVYRHEAN